MGIADHPQRGGINKVSMPPHQFGEGRLQMTSGVIPQELLVGLRVHSLNNNRRTGNRTGKGDLSTTKSGETGAGSTVATGKHFDDSGKSPGVGHLGNLRPHATPFNRESAKLSSFLNRLFQTLSLTPYDFFECFHVQAVPSSHKRVTH
jgi:hypothetical protein